MKKFFAFLLLLSLTGCTTTVCADARLQPHRIERRAEERKHKPFHINVTLAENAQIFVDGKRVAGLPADSSKYVIVEILVDEEDSSVILGLYLESKKD